MKINIIPHPTRDGWYYVDYRPDGYKGKRERIPVHGYENACRRRDLLYERYDHPEKTTETHPKIKDVYKDYLKWVEQNQSPSTYRTKKNAFKTHIIPHFGNYRVKELSQKVYDDFHLRLPGKRRAIILYQHYLAALVKWMVKRGMAKALDFKPEEPKVKKKKVIIPSMADIQTVIDSVNDEGKQAVLVNMLWTGLRWNEVRNLQWPDVDLEQDIIRVAESEGEDDVFVGIYPEMKPWLEKNRKKKGPVYVNPDTDEPWVDLKKVLATASAPLARKITHHDFRRRSGQNVYEASGWDIYAAQRHLRHKDIRTTMRYLGVDDQRRAAVQQNLIAHVAKLREEAKQKEESEKKKIVHMDNTIKPAKSRPVKPRRKKAVNS